VVGRAAGLERATHWLVPGEATARAAGATVEGTALPRPGVETAEVGGATAEGTALPRSGVEMALAAAETEAAMRTPGTEW